jgi:hypothetical protein
MEKTIKLKSFQQILFWNICFRFVIGILRGIYIFSDKLRYYYNTILANCLTLLQEVCIKYNCSLLILNLLE